MLCTYLIVSRFQKPHPTAIEWLCWRELLRTEEDTQNWSCKVFAYNGFLKSSKKRKKKCSLWVYPILVSISLKDMLKFKQLISKDLLCLAIITCKCIWMAAIVIQLWLNVYLSCVVWTGCVKEQPAVWWCWTSQVWWSRSPCHLQHIWGQHSPALKPALSAMSEAGLVSYLWFLVTWICQEVKDWSVSRATCCRFQPKTRSLALLDVRHAILTQILKLSLPECGSVLAHSKAVLALHGDNYVPLSFSA